MKRNYYKYFTSFFRNNKFEKIQSNWHSCSLTKTAILDADL